MSRKFLFTLTLGAALAFLAGPVAVSAQDLESVEPFKVGTFAIDNAPTVGLVMRDDQCRKPRVAHDALAVAGCRRTFETATTTSSISRLSIRVPVVR